MDSEGIEPPSPESRSVAGLPLHLLSVQPLHYEPAYLDRKLSNIWIYVPEWQYYKG